MNGLKRHPLLAFFGLTWAISWGIWIPLVVLQADHPIFRLGTFGPTLAALLLTLTSGGRVGLRALLKRL